MTKPVGGRGKKAPYSTVVLRIPEPLLSHFEDQAEEYRQAVVNENEPDWNSHSIRRISVVKTDLSEAIKEAKKILRSKASKEKSIAKLLQVIYGVSVSSEDLKQDNL